MGYSGHCPMFERLEPRLLLSTVTGGDAPTEFILATPTVDLVEFDEGVLHAVLYGESDVEANLTAFDADHQFARITSRTSLFTSASVLAFDVTDVAVGATVRVFWDGMVVGEAEADADRVTVFAAIPLFTRFDLPDTPVAGPSLEIGTHMITAVQSMPDPQGEIIDSAMSLPLMVEVQASTDQMLMVSDTNGTVITIMTGSSLVAGSAISTNGWTLNSGTTNVLSLQADGSFSFGRGVSIDDDFSWDDADTDVTVVPDTATDADTNDDAGDDTTAEPPPEPADEAQTPPTPSEGRLADPAPVETADAADEPEADAPSVHVGEVFQLTLPASSVVMSNGASGDAEYDDFEPIGLVLMSSPLAAVDGGPVADDAVLDALGLSSPLGKDYVSSQRGDPAIAGVYAEIAPANAAAEAVGAHHAAYWAWEAEKRRATVREAVILVILLQGLRESGGVYTLPSWLIDRVTVGRDLAEPADLPSTPAVDIHRTAPVA